MKKNNLLRNLSYYYLSIIPVLTILFAFITGHISYKIYVPLWLLNIGIMFIAVKTVAAGLLKRADKEAKYIAYSGCMLIATMSLLSVLSGMGTPPDTMQGWVDTAAEQKARFDALLASGILIALGFSLLKLVLQERGEKLYSQLGYTAIVIAIPLFFINTSFWHSYALKAYDIRLKDSTNISPGWFAAAIQQTWIITMGEVLLTYFSIALFVTSLKSAGIFKPIPSLIYVVISVVAIISILLFPFYPGSAPFSGFPYYPFMIPAIPMMMCYYIGLNLIATHHLSMPV